MTPLPIDYPLEKQCESLFKDLAWDEIDQKTLDLLTTEDSNISKEKEVHIIPQPTVAIQRFIIKLADLNKDTCKKGKVVKAADHGGMTAMMAALGKKKKKKKGTS